MSTSTMYKMKPVFDFPASFKHTSSMYKLKNIQFSRTAETSNLISQDNSISQNTELHPDEKLILSRQEKLLVELSKLKDQINAFRAEVDNLKTAKPIQKSIPASVLSTKDTVDFSAVLSELIARDIVINADPNYPPYCLLGLRKIWSDLPIQVSIHVHSSIVTLQAQVKSFDVLKKSVEGNKPKINIILVWKDVGEDCEIVTSPIKSKFITGEVNLLRYFDQYLSSDSIVVKTTKDELLDDAHRFQHISGNRKLELMKQLSDKLGNKNYFSDSKQPGVVDLALWSSFMKLKKKDNLPQNLNKWLGRSSSYFGA